MIRIITLLLLVTTLVFGQDKKGEWALVYANDEDGKPLAGNLNKLKALIRSGEPVRIGWTIEHPTNKALRVEHFAEAKFITIMSDSIVFTQIDPIVGQEPSMKDRSVTLKENVEWEFSASSLGNHDYINKDTRTGAILDHRSWKCGIRWFGKSVE